MRNVVSIRLDEGLLAHARRAAAAQHRTFTNYVETLLRSRGATTSEKNPRPAFAEAIQLLRRSRPQLEAMGVRHAAIFGSVARGTERPDSDIDILIDADPAKVNSLFAYGGIQEFLQERLGREVDLKDRARLPAHVRDAAEQEQLIAF